MNEIHLGDFFNELLDLSSKFTKIPCISFICFICRLDRLEFWGLDKTGNY
jgi:hypothetical protein